jgi:hypothetical protein
MERVRLRFSLLDAPAGFVAVAWRIALRSVGGTHWSVSAGCDAEMRGDN